MPDPRLDSPLHDAIQATGEAGELLVSWVVVSTWMTKDGRMLALRSHADAAPWEIRGLLHAGLHGAP